MSLLDIISSPDMQPVTVSITRRIDGTWNAGVYTFSSPITLSNVQMIIMPAYNMNRIVGGADMYALVDNERTFDVRQCYSAVKLYTRSPTTDPDVINYEGAQWTVGRVEEWPDLDGDLFWHAAVFKVVNGAA